MTGVRPLIVTSVQGRVLADLSEALMRAVGDEIEVRAGVEAQAWADARAGGRRSSLLIRLRGFVFPLIVDLGPRKSQRIIIATTNPFLLPAVVALRRPSARLVTLVYDLYPESLDVRFQLPRPVRFVLSAVTRFGLRRSCAVVFLGARTRDYVVDRYGLSCPTAVIPPGCSEVVGRSEPPATLSRLAADLEGKVVISYVGNLGSMHDAKTLCAAVRQVLEWKPDRCAVIISARGDLAAELVEPLIDLPGVAVLGPLDEAEWEWVTRRTDISLASLDARAGRVSLPSKVFSSLAGGTVIFAVAPIDSDLADLVKGLGVGLVVEPGHPNLAAVQLDSLVADGAMRNRFADAALRAGRGLTPVELSLEWAALLARIG